MYKVAQLPLHSKSSYGVAADAIIYICQLQSLLVPADLGADDAPPLHLTAALHQRPPQQAAH
jgi:hypothetical protein